MAGEIEEPCDSGFRMESLHSGSISFGRFESEDLSWEKRSSFNHNKYLEEVEKCSKPGSVIEKKAFLEAHFKKKGILMPSTVEFGCEYQAAQDVKHGEEYYDTYRIENEHHYDEIAIEDVDYGEHDYEIDGGGFEFENYSSSYANVNESRNDFEYLGNFKGRECEREHLASDLLSLEHQMDANDSVEGATEIAELKEANQIDISNDELHHNSDALEIPIKDDHDDDDPSHRSRKTFKVDKVNKSYRQDHTKLKTTSDGKSIKSRSKSHVKANEIQKSLNGDNSKASVKSQTKIEKDNQQRSKLEKHSPHDNTPTRDIPVSKKEELASCSSRKNVANKSEKEPKQKTAVESQSSGSKRVEHTSRLNQTVGMTQPASRATASTFTFKSGERAERRKEFYMKLEEKMHAKEAEMNQIQAKTQEKAEAEIKQFRKSLNFKATPMPSFYHSSAKPISTVNKGVSPNTRPSKAHHKVMGPGCGRVAGSKEGGDSATLFVSDSSKPAVQPESFGAMDSCITETCDSSTEKQSINNAGCSEVVTEVGISKKEGKLKNTSVGHALEKSKVSRDRRNEGKLKVKNRRNGGDMARKSIKNVGINSSKMGRLAVGVTS